MATKYVPSLVKGVNTDFAHWAHMLVYHAEAQRRALQRARSIRHARLEAQRLGARAMASYYSDGVKAQLREVAILSRAKRSARRLYAQAVANVVNLELQR